MRINNDAEFSQIDWRMGTYELAAAMRINQLIPRQISWMHGLSHQFPSPEPQTYIFDLKSLNTIELSLRKTINQRFSSKIHFRAPRPKPRLEPHNTTPLAQVLEDERESVLEKFTPSKTTNKEMKILSTASKMGKDNELESPQGKAAPKSKLIFKERTPPIKSSRFGLKLNYYYPMGERV